MLRSSVSDNNRMCESNLGKIGAAIRCLQHEVTGFTLNFLVFGPEIHLVKHNTPVHEPIAFDRSVPVIKDRHRILHRVFEDVQKRLKKAYDHSKSWYDLRRRKEF